MNILSTPFAKLLDLVQKQEQQRAQTRAERDIIARAWDAGICPECNGTDVKEISYHDTSGQSKYRCLDCGAKG